MKKYILRTDLTKKGFSGQPLHKIEYADWFVAKYLNLITKLGGWLQGEHNLSQTGDCFVAEGCEVCDNAKVVDDARVSLESIVSGDATISDSACVWNTVVYGNAVIKDHAEVNNATIFKNAEISGFAKVGAGTFFGNAKVYDRATIVGNPTVQDDVVLRGSLYIAGNPTLLGTQTLYCPQQVVTFNVGLLDITITPYSIVIVKHPHPTRRGGPIQTKEVTSSDLEKVNFINYDVTLSTQEASRIKTLVLNTARLLKKETL